MTGSADAAFRARQRQVAKGMAAGAAIALAALGIAFVFGAYRPLDERLASAAVAMLAPVCWLAASIAQVARLRFGSPDAIEGARSDRPESQRLRDARAILQNTLEQAALAIPLYICVALLFDRGGALVAALAATFSAGRLLFWWGYADGARGRASGFALTFYPQVIVLIGLVVMAALRAFI